MIDFRYHLISIVAVFLALGIGILMGSVVLDQRLVSNIRANLDRIEATNEELRESNAQLRRQVELDEQFALAARDLLLQGSLRGRTVVLVTLAGTDGELLDAVRSAIDLAEGEVATMLEVTEKLSLPGDPERDELSLITGAVTSSPNSLRGQLGRLLGERARAAALRGTAERGRRGGGGASLRLQALVDDLAESGFVKVEDGFGLLVPSDARFVIVGGGSAAPPFALADFMLPFVAALAEPGVAVLVAEGSTSVWGLVEELRNDGETQQKVITVDQAQSTSGTIAVVLGLVEAAEGCVGRHYGVQDGVTGIIPRLSQDGC